MITSSNSGSEAVGIINQALEDAGSSVTIGNESGSSVSDKLNEVFGDDLLDDTQSGSVWAQAVEDGFDGLEPQPSLDTVVKFLHVSDPHGSATATTTAKGLLANDTDISFLFVTGDVSRYTYNDLTDGLAADLNDIAGDDKLLLLPGNHDTYDITINGKSGQNGVTSWVKSMQSGMGVTYGDTGGVSAYWHKDIQLSASSKLRIISLDQYEISKVRRGNYHTMYTQAQVDWLIGLLTGLTANDYVIIAMHEPPVQSPSGTNDSSSPDKYAVGLRPTTPYFTNGELSEPKKLFVSEGLRAFGNRYNEPSMNLLPRIIYAYMHKQQLNMTYNNYNGNASNPDITINEDFSQVTPATFLFFIGGHRHADICTYLPDETQSGGGDWSDQLMLYITCGDAGINYQYDDDLGGTGSAVTPKPTNTDTYRLNEVELDFGEQTITVERIGACNTAGGRVRSSVTFPFVKEGGES